MASKDWRKSVVYQIYPKSFNDTTGSGEGDIRGIIDKLDYFTTLGVDYLWLTPVYESPMNDNGYDISNYYEVNPQFGTKADLEELLEKAHARGLKIMMDIVINHTSTEHHWFVESRKSRDNEYRDYYIWKDGTYDTPPTNWESKFGGNAWAYDEDTNQYYLRLFDITQADLNWENEDMRRDIYEMINYWIDFGVDGFRFDVVNLISKGEFKNSEGPGKEFYTDGPKVHEYINELNRNTFGDKDIMTVGEMSSTTIEHCLKYTNPERNELNSVFNFHHLKVDYPGGEKWSLANFDFLELKKILMEWQVAMDEGGGWNAIFWCNHDQPRVVSRFGNDETEENRLLSGKMLAIALHGLKGTPYIYQGEEIGMTNPGFNRIDQYRDVESLNAYSILREEGMDASLILDILATKSRDNSRTPVQWDDSRNAGFTEGMPWIEVSDKYGEINVARALEDGNSIFYTYQKLIELRHELDVLTYGSVKPHLMKDDDLFVYERLYEGERITVMANFRNKEVPYPENINAEGEVLLSNYADRKNVLRPFEAMMIYGQNN
ncbi:alpha,alpha-phosphotrehalase [Salinicoccus roseus]|jgi:trehalose-6-phosphate hydrolase|uniref:Alpha,alpha-phosphotrehalase n=1 Tax=Salinicoccus roseus TaxID=45670 RepID=A0A265E466_9STAP|nr:alpha,alpha-phosphotrehalase [Salinicoccus roseus]OZT76295.1 alpha,alpha-phosphotrehalase [Salinicoccus roseus]RPE51191.1 trehalose-6-phosphate hydrolase [Salinicoccus roseus]GGA77262.1 glucohydrolase [Salinicoccus roseus]